MQAKAAAGSNQAYAKQRACVIGAGPAGTLSALFLAKHGFKVDVFERAPVEAVAGGASVGLRSYNILLVERGIQAIERQAGIPFKDDGCIRIQGSARYTTAKPKAAINPALGAGSVSINRGSLAGHVYTETKRLFPEQVTFNFQATLSDLKLSEGRASFLQNGTAVECEYDLLVAADGARSEARDMFVKQVPGFSFTALEDSMEYKVLKVPLGTVNKINPDCMKHFNVFIEIGDAYNASMLVSPCVDGTMQGPCIMGDGHHDRLTASNGYEAALKQAFPVFNNDEDYKYMASQLMTCPVSTGGVNVRCSQLHGPKAILMGDAAHGMWPALGQGTNCALESAATLDKVLEDCKGDASLVPEKFNAARLEDALAAVEITEGGFGGTKFRTAKQMSSMAKFVGRYLLSKVVPWLVSKPALMTLNSGERRYSDVLKEMTAQNKRAERVITILQIALVVAVALAAKAILRL